MIFQTVHLARRKKECTQTKLTVVLLSTISISVLQAETNYYKCQYSINLNVSFNVNHR